MVGGSRVRWEITSGNIWSIVTTLGTGAGILATVLLAYGDLKSKDALHEQRLSILEAESKEQRNTTRIDHDILIEIRQDLKSLKQLVDRMTPVTPFRKTEAEPRGATP